MELIEKKIVKLQDAKFKTHQNLSNESSIFIDKDIASKINLIHGENISFIINEENLLRALSFVFQFKKPLFKKEEIVLDQDWFNKEYEIIRKHFENGNKYTCNVNNSNGRFYLKSLPQTSGLNIRNLLIENYFQLEFYKDTDNIVLKLYYSEEELSKTSEEITHAEKLVVSSKKLTEFSLTTILFLKKEFGDKFIEGEVEKYNTKVGKYKHVGYKLPKYFKSVRVFGAFENDSTFKQLLSSKERTRYHSDNLYILNESNIYFSTEIEFNKTDRSSNLYFGDFKKFIEDYSKGKYSIRKENDDYELIEINMGFKSTWEQKIFFGPPGTGKSHHIKENFGYNLTRITFHPELDYQGFVGAYKPSMISNHISYKFIPEAFSRAYCESWKSNDPHYLIIEEINRGNCAQIFGDIFQLLDRNNNGYSEYPIICSPDLQAHLKDELGKMKRLFDYEKETGNDDFSRMTLPNNLNIICTMNTSDQSLFPMDSAFKRRWDWQYIAINYDDARKFQIDLEDGQQRINWGSLIKALNEKIKDHTKSEDKQIGNRFVSPANGIISKDEFVSKVVFYLWSEIYKEEQSYGDSIFYTDNNTEITFSDFFKNGQVNSSITRQFIEHNLPNNDNESEIDISVKEGESVKENN